jgi:hypothetical protein
VKNYLETCHGCVHINMFTSTCEFCSRRNKRDFYLTLDDALKNDWSGVYHDYLASQNPDMSLKQNKTEINQGEYSL